MISVETSREDLRDLMVQFVSLGQNCELGLVQSAVRVEPLSLFSFAATTCKMTTEVIGAKFAGVGDPTQTETFFERDEPEFLVRDRRFGFSLHTQMYRDQHSEADVLKRERSRLPFLSRSLAEDLEDGSRVFVVKQGWYPPTQYEVEQLAAAVRQWGPGYVLWVKVGPLGSCGQVFREGPNLLVGYIDRFAPVECAGDFSLGGWVALCRRALGARDQLRRKTNLQSHSISSASLHARHSPLP